MEGGKVEQKRIKRGGGRRRDAPLFCPCHCMRQAAKPTRSQGQKGGRGEKGSASQARGFARRGENLSGGRISIIRLIGPDVSTCFNFSCRLNLKEYSKNTASLSWDALKGVSSPLARGQPVPIMNSQKMRRSLFPTPGALPQKLGGWVT